MPSAPSAPSTATTLTSVKTLARTPVTGAARTSGQGATPHSTATNALAAAAAASLFSSYGSGPSARGPVSGSSSKPLSKRDLAALAGLSLRTQVRALAGCLADLPERLGLVLEMRAGILTGKALSIAAVARELHVTARQARRMQRRALRTLLRTARVHGCATAAGTATRFVAGLSAAALGALAQPFGALGGVLAARYSEPVSQAGPGASQAGLAGENALGLSHPGGKGGALLAVAIVLAGILLIAVLFAEELGLGPQLRWLRARWLRRPSR